MKKRKDIINQSNFNGTIKDQTIRCNLTAKVLLSMSELLVPVHVHFCVPSVKPQRELTFCKKISRLKIG